MLTLVNQSNHSETLRKIASNLLNEQTKITNQYDQLCDDSCTFEILFRKNIKDLILLAKPVCQAGTVQAVKDHNSDNF